MGAHRPSANWTDHRMVMQGPMASTRPFPLQHARKWAPDADPTDLSTVFPNLPGVKPQEALLALADEQTSAWMSRTPKSKQLQDRGRISMPWGVFATGQKDWGTPHLLYAQRCAGNKLWDMDGNEYLDVNFGDSPDMFGRSPDNPVHAAVAERLLSDGLSTMMCTEDALVATALLSERFGLSHWMHALSASDANRFVLAIARHHTGRRNIAIPNFTYHGTIDETLKFMPSPGRIARFHELDIYHGDVEQGTKIFNWNDLDSVEEILQDRSVACVMLEPVMSNFGWAWPLPGWHEGLRELCDEYGTLLCYDETHTIGRGRRGMVGHLGISGDFWTCGKSISSGVPGAVFGMTEEIAATVERDHTEAGFFSIAGFGFLGTSSCGNALSTLALRATLEQVLTEDTFARIDTAARAIKAGMQDSIERHRAPFRIETMGNRICYQFIPEAVTDPICGLVQLGFGGLFELSHAYFWNHGVLISPYYNMCLITPSHSDEDTARLLEVWDEFVELVME